MAELGELLGDALLFAQPVWPLLIERQKQIPFGNDKAR